MDWKCPNERRFRNDELCDWTYWILKVSGGAYVFAPPFSFAIINPTHYREMPSKKLFKLKSRNELSHTQILVFFQIIRINNSYATVMCAQECVRVFIVYVHAPKKERREIINFLKPITSSTVAQT